MTQPALFEVELTNLVYGGDAIGRLPDGRAVFVPGVLPGERARVRLTEQKKGFARGVLVELVQSSPDRVEVPPGCEGCQYAFMNYPAQLRFKTAILSDQLQRIAGIQDPPVVPIVPSPQEWHYRNTVQFHLTPDGRLGFPQQGSHNVIPVEDCLLCEPKIQEVLPYLDFSSELEGGQLPSPGLERIQVRAGADDIMLVLESSDPVAPAFSVDFPISAVFVGPDGFDENEPIVLAGSDMLVMEVLGRAFRVSAGSFFQVNTAQAETMTRYLLDNLPITPASEVLEVYAGVGLFSAFIAPRVTQLTAVESAPSAVNDFTVNLDEFDNVSLYAGLAEEILPGLDLHPDVVLVDPPRAGLALPALDALIKMEAPFLAYISCDPATLARDVKRLAAAGYRLDRVQPFDMFPQTYHIETICFLSHKDK